MIAEVKNLVVIDDEKYVCNIIMEALSEFSDFNIHKFTDPQKALEYIKDNGTDLVLTDLVMGEYSGVQILDTTLNNHPDAVVILMTGYPTVKTAISVLKKGGYDYLIKPFKLEDLKSTIIRGLEHQKIKRENVQLRSQLELMKVSDAVARGIKLYPLLGLIADAIIRELSADAASIMLLDRRANRYRVRYISREVESKPINEFLNGKGPHGALNKDFDHSHVYNDMITIEDKEFKRSMIVFPLISKGINIGFLNIVCIDQFAHVSAGQRHLISLLASTAAAAVESDYMDRNLQRSYLMTIKALANAIEARDMYTAGHTDRVYRLAKVIARRLDWDKERLLYLRQGCILHDIGKIGVPDAILNKPGKLTDAERKIMQKHPEMGARILRGIPFLAPVIPYIISHHERYDGNGYPYGLKGENIPIEGRVLAVVDTFDAILSDRPYRPSANPEKAIDELTKFKELQFDPKVVDAFLDAFNDGEINAGMIYKRAGSKVEGTTREITAPV